MLTRALIIAIIPCRVCPKAKQAITRSSTSTEKWIVTKGISSNNLKYENLMSNRCSGSIKEMYDERVTGKQKTLCILFYSLKLNFSKKMHLWTHGQYFECKLGEFKGSSSENSLTIANNWWLEKRSSLSWGVATR